MVDILWGGTLIGLILVGVWVVGYGVALGLKRDAKRWAPIASLVVMLLFFTKFHPIVSLGMTVTGVVGFLWIRAHPVQPMFAEWGTAAATAAILLFPAVSGLLEQRFLESRFVRYEVMTLVIGLVSIPLGGVVALAAQARTPTISRTA